ncbi:CapA family protein [Nocardioides sp.]|uniref:CapA family protein n=1 Tax=Nocardioides sp. TaxID=35761 RepID=UPI0037836FA0
MRRWVVVGAFLLALAAAGCDDQGPADIGQDPQGAPSTPAPGPTDPVTTDSPTTSPTGPRTVSIVMSGDLLWHNTVWFSAAEDAHRAGTGAPYDWDPMFAWLKPTIEDADLAICHEEVPFAARGQEPESYPVFAAPRSIGPWIASMGWDACTTASNHSWDQGFEGVETTADLLDRNGVAHVGTFRSAAERDQPVIITTAEGVKVGLVAGTFGLNGFVVPPEQDFAVSMWDATNLLDQARAAREAGADVVVVHVHWGIEYDHSPDAAQVELARQLTASPDVDLVLGEHAHVVQPITKVNGKWVVYGMGNAVAQNEVSIPSSYEGITVHFDLAEQPDGGWRVDRASYLPTQWNHYVPGDPIRITRATGSHLASIRAAVDGVGHNAGLQED